EPHHRLPRPLHHRPEGAGGLAQPADRRHPGPRRQAPAVGAADQRRRNPREHRVEPAAPHEGARQRPDAVLAACELHGAPHRRLRGLQHLGRHLQRAVLPGQRAVPGPLRTGGHAAAVARGRPAHLHPGAGQVRRAVRVRRHQPQPRPVRRPLEGAAADRPPLVSGLREDGGVRHPRHDPRVDLVQRLLPHHRGALPERGHHRLHAVPAGRPVQGLPGAALPDPARRRRGALPLGPLPRPGAGDEEAAARRAPAEQHLLRHLRLPPAGHRPAQYRGAGEERAVRLRDDRRGARHRPDHRPLLRRHQALHRCLDDPQCAGQARDLRGQHATRVPAPGCAAQSQRTL
ncbi:MAG: 4-oxalomesaconate hydratase, partial [uncultured Ramlibacter sp.]